MFLNQSTLKSLSTVCANFSEVFLASLVIPFFTSGIEKKSYPMLLFGLLMTITSVGLSLIFADKGNI
jgi:hypothetical protein